MKTTLFKVTVLSGCISAIFSSLPVAAQSVPATGGQTAAQGSAGPATLDEIVVTAQKRSEKQQDVPVAVTALSPKELEELNIVSVAGLTTAVPNVIINNALGQNSIMAFIRGIGTANPVFSSDPAVGIYIDDVYLARAIGANSALFDVERVEVLRGPQGTLYGANSPAGAIKIITAKPSLTDGYKMLLQTTVGSYSERGLNVAANLPIIEDKVAARLVVQSANRDGVQTNLEDGTKAGTLDSSTIRLHLLSRLSNRWDLLLSADNTRVLTNPRTGVNFGGTGGVDLFTTPGFDKRNFFSEMQTRYDNSYIKGYTANIHGQFDDAEFRSITAYRKLKQVLNQEGDARKGLSLFDNTQNLDNSQFSQEFNFSGTRGPLDWVVGTHFMREKTDFFWHVRILRSVIPPLGLNPNFEINDQIKTGSSLFTQNSWKVTDKLTLAGGFRWTRETKDFHIVGYRPTANVDVGIPPGTPIPGFDVTRSKTWTAPQWRVASDYKLTGDAMVFASVARGFRSGGFNGGARSIPEATANPFDPEFVTTYELGTKTEWFNRRLRFNATYFYNDYKDQQVAFLAGAGADAAFGTSTVNAKIKGWEFETSVLPIKGLRLFANLSTLRGDTNSKTTLFAPNPKLQYTVGFTSSGPIANGVSWNVGANYFHTAQSDQSPLHDPLRRVSAYGDLGARMGLSSDNGRWKLELSGTNLRNDYWHIFSFNIPRLFTVRTPNDPRMVHLIFTVKI